jgi:tetratricopeptide (TPR) repeat protein
MPASDRIDELNKRYDENPRRFFASLANEYRKAGDLEQAISICQAHLADQPSNMNGHVVYGQALFEAGRYDDAKATFDTALGLDPENLIALRHLGDIACTNGDNDTARAWYERVLDADPRNEEIIALLAHLAAESARGTSGASTAPVEADVPRASYADYRPPQVITPLSTTPVADPTPIVPLDAIKTVHTPAVSKPPAAPPESLGLVDLEIDFDTTMDVAADMASDAIAATPASHAAEPTQPEPPAEPFVTETMAELYLQQGFKAEALEVYRQLSSGAPHDEALKERVRKLEQGDRASLSFEIIPDGEPDDTAVDAGGVVHDLMPERGPEPIPERIRERRADTPSGTARSYFAGLAARRAVQGNRRTPTPPRTSAPGTSAPRTTGSQFVAAGPGPSLEELFSGQAVSPRDEQAALAFAQVAGAVEMGSASVKGKPTAPAATELSLDSVFREAEPRATASVTRQSQTLRFDQFFAVAGDEVGTQTPPSGSAPAGEPGSPAELQQFQSWLTRLKKP